jgi:hypothetical protein
MALRNFNLPQRQPIHSPLPKLPHKNQESSAVRLLLFSVPSEIPRSKTKSGTTLGTLLKTVLSSEENFSGFTTVLKGSTFSSCSSCGSSFSVAINCEPRARENPSALVCSLAKLAAIRRYERERERRLLGFRDQGGGGIPPPFYVDAKSSHTDDKFIHPISILLFQIEEIIVGIFHSSIN